MKETLKKKEKESKKEGMTRKKEMMEMKEIFTKTCKETDRKRKEK
jgi:hypothetical protein